MTLPGAPCIYYGDELGMEGGMDPACRGAFPTDPGQWGREPAGWIADLTTLRHSSRALRDGELVFLGAEGTALAYLRRHGTDSFVCVLNAGASSLSWDLPVPAGAASAAVVELRSERAANGRAEVVDGRLRVVVPERHGLVVRLHAG